MKGMMRTYRPGDAVADRIALLIPPPGELLDDLIGGNRELIQNFDTLHLIEGNPKRCVAFQNSHAKIDHLPVNEIATLLWEEALKRKGLTLRRGDTLVDLLVGPIIVITGDDELLSSL